MSGYVITTRSLGYERTSCPTTRHLARFRHIHFPVCASLPANVLGEGVAASGVKLYSSFRLNLIMPGRVKARPADRIVSSRGSLAGLHASRDSFFLIGVMLAACTAKIMSLMNKNTISVLRAIVDLQRR
jgi:hypothetical protein